MVQDEKSRANEAAHDPEKGDAFLQQVTAALDHCGDTAWLGRNSPLAAPYLLGKRLDMLRARQGTPAGLAIPPSPPNPASPAERGAALREAIDEASTLIEDEELRSIIQIRYLKRNQHLSNTGLALRSGVSERTFYRLRVRALGALSAALYSLLVPPLRLEHPEPPPIAGRTAPAAALDAALQAGKSVYLAGESGIGKSSLAAAVLRGLAETHDTFWFTVRPGFNDHFDSFVFALAYFLHEHGAANTWRQIIAESGRIHEERTLALLRHDCMSLGRPVVLCIDEIDQLRVEISEHSRLFTLMESLQSIATGKITLLLIGQRVVQRTPEQVTLQGLSLEEVRQWLAAAAPRGGGADMAERLFEVTGGSPLLLVLLAALLQTGEVIESVLARFSENPSLESLLVRIWQRLDSDERVLLMQVAVFEVAAPYDAWREQADRIASLVERKLLQLSSSSLLTVVPHLRALIYARTPAELRRQFHADAAHMLEERGNITGAMRHAVKARDEAGALLLWLAHRDEQVARGQASVALQVLRPVAESDLPSPALGSVLQTARADLELLLGDAESANTTLRTMPALAEAAAEGYRTYLLARSHELLGDAARADALLQTALRLLTPPTLFVRLRAHNMQGYLRILKLRDLAQGRRVAAGARVEAEVLQGWVEEASGNLAAARDCFASALALAEQTHAEPRTMAYVHTNLGRVLMNLSDTTQGLVYMQRAVEEYEAMGDLPNALSNRINIAYAQTISGHAEDALATAATGLEPALRMKSPYLIAGLAAAAGEAAVFANEPEEAERYLTLSLNQEEEFHRPWALTALGALRARQDRHREAVRLLETAAHEAQQIEDLHAEAYALHPLAVSQVALGELEAARHAALRAHELYAALGMQNESRVTAALLETLPVPP